MVSMLVKFKNLFTINDMKLEVNIFQ